MSTEAHDLLHECLREMARWRSCQNIGACRNCADDGVILRLRTYLNAHPSPQYVSSRVAVIEECAAHLDSIAWAAHPDTSEAAAWKRAAKALREWK